MGKQTTYGHGGRAVTWDLRGDTSSNLQVGEGSPTLTIFTSSIARVFLFPGTLGHF